MALAIRDLYEKRNRALKLARELSDKARVESRDLNAEEQKQWDGWMGEVNSLKAQITREERMLELENDQAFASGERRALEISTDPALSKDENEKRQMVAMRNYICGRPIGQGIEGRALQIDTDSKGGFWVPPQMQAMIRQELDNMVFIRQFASVFPTPVVVSESLGVPTLEADIEDLDWTGEITTADEDTAMQAGKRELTSHLLSKLIKVSNPMLQKRPDVETLVAKRLAYKHGIVAENAYLNGSGSGRPLGVFTASAAGISTGRDYSTNNTTSAPTFLGLVGCKYNLKAQYRKNARWVFHRDGVSKVAQIVDGQNLPVFKLAESTGQTDTLLGYPLHESEYAPNTFTTGLYIGILGDFSFYEITDAPFSIQRLNELYAATNQVGFIGRGGGDGMPIFENAFSRVKLA